MLGNDPSHFPAAADRAARMRAVDDEQPATRLDSLNRFDVWIATWAESPVTAVRELARCADATFDILLADGDVDAQSEECGRWWAQITRAVSAMRAGEPDPRLGRELLETLRSPSDHWFRVDQVRHMVTTFDKTDDTPSFADHLLALLEVHRHSGLPGEMDAMADIVGKDADCNGSEMETRLRDLAARLRTQHGYP